MKGSGLLLLNFKEKKDSKRSQICKRFKHKLRENDDIFKPK